MISRKGLFTAILLTSILLPWHAWGDTLLQIDEKGDVAPNLVKEWKVIDDAVLLKLGADVETESQAIQAGTSGRIAVIRERLDVIDGKVGEMERKVGELQQTAADLKTSTAELKAGLATP